MKKLILILMAALLVMGISGCSTNNDTPNQNKPVSEEQIPLELLGYYYDEIAGRGVLNIYNAKGMEADAQIKWASSAFAG